MCVCLCVYVPVFYVSEKARTVSKMRELLRKVVGTVLKERRGNGFKKMAGKCSELKKVIGTL